MRLARRALVAALATLMLCAIASAQTLRPENDPRNTAPTVGTGGPTGGPTGLFTIYDGQTLRRGEFTFSFAYSNWDRDPGNADFTEVPVSFQVGLNDHLELFFNIDAYRGVKVNNPAHLSGFYLPNINPFVAGVPSRSSPAIILAPLQNQLVQLQGITVFRPTNSQPFVPYPYIGGPGSNLGLFLPPPGALFGVPGGLQTTLGVAGGGGGRFGPANNFPGIGSPVGGILPGIVLTTVAVPGVPGGQPFVTGPGTFTTAPAYLPDAPFIGRLYGTSSFSTLNVGAKWRWTGPNNPLGVGIVAAYRWFFDDANDAGGFNMLQRGASPGGNFGDINVTLFVDGRLGRSVNLSANFGYWFNSSVRSNAFGGQTVTLLDRPDEFIGGVGFDFPVNRYFQPIAELRFTHYVGGRTPNAFENSPIDVLLGFRAFPARWVGFGAAYRRHLNQQSQGQFSQTFPAGFTPSDDPNGFLGQFFIGRRNERAPEFLPNQPPVGSLMAAESTITLPCPPGQTPRCDPPPSPDQQVALTANFTDPDGDTLLYTYSVTGGRIIGEGPNVTWDLAGAQPGTYTATVEVDDGCGCISYSSATVTVAECVCELPCPIVSVTCPDSVNDTPDAAVTFTANVSGGDPNVSPTYNWSVSAGEIIDGQGTPSITVRVAGLGGQSVTATVNVGGYPPECATSASCTTSVIGRRMPYKFDEYGNIAFNDEKARLDNFAIELQNNPDAQGYIIAYGGRRGRAGEAMARADRAKNYLVNTRGVDPGRIVTVDGGYREDLTVELWIVPSGADTPEATPTVDASEVQIITPRRAPRRRR